MAGGQKLQISDLCMEYETVSGSVSALSNVNFAVASGEFVSIVGASGCGKTTLLKIIDGLIPPSSGCVTLDGREVHGPGPNRGFVFQSDSLLPWRTIVDNVQIGLELQGKPKKSNREAALQALRRVGLESFASAYPDVLSGGMRQRANLARALVISPEIFLMDEPFAALDSQTREIMQSELIRIWNMDGIERKTVLFVTHQIDEAVYLSDRVIVMSARPGRVREEIEIDIPRPRGLDVKRTPEFSMYSDRIWRLIESEVRESIDRELESHDTE